MRDKEPIEEIRQARLAREAPLSPSSSATDATPARRMIRASRAALHTPIDLADQSLDYRRDLGLPGQHPFTRRRQGMS